MKSSGSRLNPVVQYGSFVGLLHQLRLYIITSVIGRFCRAQQRASAGVILDADYHRRHSHILTILKEFSGSTAPQRLGIGSTR